MYITNRRNKTNKANKEKGITLIDLVITIVVLLLLAGVSIGMLTGENGIITQATNAINKTESAGVKEQVNLWKLELMIDSNSKTKEL